MTSDLAAATGGRSGSTDASSSAGRGRNRPLGYRHVAAPAVYRPAEALANFSAGGRENIQALHDGHEQLSGTLSTIWNCLADA
jgi:hypothetical protein